MKQIAVYLNYLMWAVVMGGVALAQGKVNPFENNVYAFFADPVLFASAVTFVSGWLNELIVDGLKDRNPALHGKRTQAVAAVVAALLGGAGGYFGLSYFTDVSGLEGAGTAAAMALGSWLFADFKHRAGRLRDTGERKQVREAVTGATDAVLAGLLAQAATLHPAVAIAVPVLTSLYNKHGKQVVQDLIEQQRALTPDEARAYVEGSQAERSIHPPPPPSVAPAPPAAPRTRPLATPTTKEG